MSTDIDIVPRYSSRAEAYQQFRWPFDRQVITSFLAIAGLSSPAVVVDIGCGTGMSSLPFVLEGCEVVGIEPNSNMRLIAERVLGNQGCFRCTDGRAEATGLPDDFADLIVVGRALHWFDQPKARREFARISKLRGWLTVMAVACTDETLVAATRNLQSEASGWDTQAGKPSRLVERFEYFFDEEGCREIAGPRVIHETWEQFFGRLHTLSSAPDPSDPRHERFEQEAKYVFNAFRKGDKLVIPTSTRITYGHPARERLQSE